MPIGYAKIINIQAKGMAIKMIKTEGSGGEFHIRILGYNHEIRDGFLSSFAIKNNISAFTKITMESPIKNLSYKDFGDYVMIYFWHNGCFLQIRFEQIYSRPIPEYTILEAQTEIPEDVIPIE